MGALPVPPAWAIVLAILGLLFGGTYGIVWMVRKEIRESRAAPELEKAQQLQNQKTAEDIAGMLREEQRKVMADMRQLLADERAETDRLRGKVDALDDLVRAGEAATTAARAEAKALREKLEELEEARQRDRDEQDRHNARVERLLAELTAAGVEIPAWWAAGA